MIPAMKLLTELDMLLPIVMTWIGHSSQWQQSQTVHRAIFFAALFQLQEHITYRYIESGIYNGMAEGLLRRYLQDIVTLTLGRSCTHG